MSIDKDYLVEGIKKDDLTEAMQELCECIGMQGLINLMKRYGGGFVYVSTIEAAKKDARDREIRRELRAGKGYHQVALKYGLSDSWVRKIANQKTRQLALF